MGAKGAAIATLLAAALVAGCFGGGSEPTSAATEAAPDALDDTAMVTPTPAAAMAAEAASVVTEVPLALDGLIPTGVLVCASVLSCEPVDTTEPRTEILIDGLVGNVTAGRVTLTWTATSELTRELGVGLMTMWPGCADCQGEEFLHEFGPSPIELDVSGLRIPIAEGGVIHLYVYPAGFAADTTYVGPSLEQAFTVEGAVTLEKLSG